MKKLTVFVGVLALLAFAPLAHADYVIGYSVNGGAIQLCQDSPSDTAAGCFTAATGVGGGVTIFNLSGSSNSPGSPIFSDQAGGAITVTTGIAPATLALFFSAQDFTSPTAPPALSYSSHLALTTFSPVGTATAALTSCIDQTNSRGVPIGPGKCPATDNLTNTSISISGVGSGNNTITTIITALGSPYALDQVATLTLGANASVNLVTSQTLTPSVPEPASLALFGSGLLGLAGLLRRKLVRV